MFRLCTSPGTRLQAPAHALGEKIAGLLLVLALALGPLAADRPRPITVQDCVRTRRVVEQEVALSPDGTRVAYVVKAPNLATDQNDYLLYVRGLNPDGLRANGRLLLEADRISEMRWLDSESIAALAIRRSVKSVTHKSQIVFINAASGGATWLRHPGGIVHFSASAGGDTIVFAASLPVTGEPFAADAAGGTRECLVRGYAIRFGAGIASSLDHLPEDALFLARRTSEGVFDVRRLTLAGVGRSPAASLRDVERLDLSPDGKQLLLVYSAESLPKSWMDEPYLQFFLGQGNFYYSYVLGLYDISTGRLDVAFNFPGAVLHTEWSEDSRSYAVVGPSPFGTKEARYEQEEASATGEFVRSMADDEDVFTIDLATRKAALVVRRRGSRLWHDLPMWWQHADGPMLLRTSNNRFAWFTSREGKWSRTSEFLFLEDSEFLSSLASDGRVLVGVVQTTTAPPDLVALDLATHRSAVLTDLNPEYRSIELGKVERFAWTNRYGSKCSGFMILPPGYRPGKRYPMVFLSAPPSDVFISDAVYTTAYAPQPLADAGFVVVISQYPLDDCIPKGRYPGEMNEAYNWMSMVESAIDLLSSRGIVDPNRVGLSGFSRTSWLTDFTLTHSTFKFVAASSADGGIYTYGNYFAFDSFAVMKGFETEVGGPPYGETFHDWLRSAPPFEAQSVMAAVLMEYTGTAAQGFEFFTALRRLGKAAELYRYPRGSHPLDTPWERVASLQRNVDWFRFWIQGREGNAPTYDPGQYVRWRALRAARGRRESTAKSLTR